MEFREGFKKLERLPGWLKDRPAWMRKKITGDVLDEREERVPIYAYLPRFRSVFASCLVVGTPAIWFTVVALTIAEPGDRHWTTMVVECVKLIPIAGFSAVIIGIITVEVAEVLAEIFRDKEKDRLLKERDEKIQEQAAALQERDEKIQEQGATLEEQGATLEELQEEVRKLRERLDEAK